jgi:hypothetical protein
MNNNTVAGTVHTRSTTGIAASVSDADHHCPVQAHQPTQVGFTTPPVQNNSSNNKCRHVDTVNTVTPSSGNSACVPNVYGTGPPRGAALNPKIPVSILCTPSASPTESASTRSKIINDRTKQVKG